MRFVHADNAIDHSIWMGKSEELPVLARIHSQYMLTAFETRQEIIMPPEI